MNKKQREAEIREEMAKVERFMLQNNRFIVWPSLIAHDVLGRDSQYRHAIKILKRMVDEKTANVFIRHRTRVFTIFAQGA